MVRELKFEPRWKVECKDCGFPEEGLTFREATARGTHQQESPTCQMIFVSHPETSPQ